MEPKPENQYNPDVVSPPHTTIQETFAEQGVLWTVLVHYGGLLEEEAYNVFHGYIPIDKKAAHGLETVTGIPVLFWLNRQQQYDEASSRLGKAGEEQENLESDLIRRKAWEIYKEIASYKIATGERTGKTHFRDALFAARRAAQIFEERYDDLPGEDK